MEHKALTARPLHLVYAGILTGFAYEGCATIYRRELYKNIFRFAKTYPGFTLSSFTCFVGLGWSYKVMIGDLFRGFVE